MDFTISIHEADEKSPRAGTLIGHVTLPGGGRAEVELPESIRPAIEAAGVEAEVTIESDAKAESDSVAARVAKRRADRAAESE